MPTAPSTRTVQLRLRSLGYTLGTSGPNGDGVDGEYGPRTQAAVARFQLERGIKATGGGPLKYPGSLGPATLALLFPEGVVTVAPVTEPPWMVEGRRVMGLHETTNRSALMAWLRRDGHALGDPTKLPWCGDFVDTSVRLSLPTEVFPGALGQNPYWARNWLLFGRPCEARRGAVVVFGRDGGGHVAFVVGLSADGKYVYCLGGNQSNRVSIVKMSVDRVLGYRWPTTYPLDAGELPTMNGGVLSTNEA